MTISGRSGKSPEPSLAALWGQAAEGIGAGSGQFGPVRGVPREPISAVGVVFGSQWGALKIILMMLTANTHIALTLPPALPSPV